MDINYFKLSKIVIKRKKMPRYKIENPPIKVAYGYDGFSGTFLSVYDKRLEVDDKTSDEINEIAKSIGPGDGCYLDLHTGPTGYGKQVSDKTIYVYLKRFGVPENHIKALLSGSIVCLEQY